MPIIVTAAQSSSLRLYAGLWPVLDDIASASERRKNFLTANLPLILSLHRPKCRFVAAFRLGKSLSRCRAGSGSQREPRTRIPTLIVYVVGSEIELDRGLTRALHHLDHCHRESVPRHQCEHAYAMLAFVEDKIHLGLIGPRPNSAVGNVRFVPKADAVPRGAKPSAEYVVSRVRVAG